MQFIQSWFQTLANIYFAIVNGMHACLCTQSIKVNCGTDSIKCIASILAAILFLSVAVNSAT